MWMVIHMAKSLSAAERLQKRLTEEGFMARLRPISRAADAEDSYYELLVLHSEAQGAVRSEPVRNHLRQRRTIACKGRRASLRALCGSALTVQKEF